MAKNKKPNQLRDEKVEIETFQPSTYWITSMQQNEPICFNGVVSVRKYKVTRELIEEPIEVLQQRLQDLWDKTDNYHHVTPLRKAAEELEYVLVGPYGSKAKK